jgi:hypothetical protein
MTIYQTTTPERAPPQTTAISASDDVRTIMLNEISWGAVVAGALIGLVVQLILNMVGIGVGLSTVNAVAGDSPSASSISMGAGLWWVISGIIAAGIGGYLAGRLSGKPSHSTTAYHGLISWALSVLVVVYLVSSAASGLVGGALSGATTVLGGAGKVIGDSVQTAAPSLNSMNDPMSRIVDQVRSSSGGQDPAALRDAAATSVRGALSGDPSQQAAATDKAAEALAKAQNIPADQAKAQIAQYQQQYKDMVARTKEQAKEAADATARTVSRGALFGALALLLGALAAFFAGQAGAVVPTVSGYRPRP